MHGQSNMEAPGGCVRGRVCSMCMGVYMNVNMNVIVNVIVNVKVPQWH